MTTALVFASHLAAAIVVALLLWLALAVVTGLALGRHKRRPPRVPVHLESVRDPDALEQPERLAGWRS